MHAIAFGVSGRWNIPFSVSGQRITSTHLILSWCLGDFACILAQEKKIQTQMVWICSCIINAVHLCPAAETPLCVSKRWDELWQAFDTGWAGAGNGTGFSMTQRLINGYFKWSLWAWWWYEVQYKSLQWNFLIGEIQLLMSLLLLVLIY